MNIYHTKNLYFNSTHCFRKKFPFYRPRNFSTFDQTTTIIIIRLYIENPFAKILRICAEHFSPFDRNIGKALAQPRRTDTVNRTERKVPLIGHVSLSSLSSEKKEKKKQVRNSPRPRQRHIFRHCEQDHDEKDYAKKQASLILNSSI